MARFALSLLIVILVLAIGAVGFFGFFLLESTPPAITVSNPPSSLGRETSISIRATDERSGLREISVSLVQGDKTFPVASRTFEKGSRWLGSGVKDAEETFTIRPVDLGLASGPAKLQVSARDSSLWDGSRGNEGIWKADVAIDLTPPAISLKSTFHNLNSGGTGVTTFTVNEDVTSAGVYVEGEYFPAHPTPGIGKGSYTAFFAVPYTSDRIERLVVQAVDRAGNVTVSGIPHRIKYRRPTVDRIIISDSFLASKMPEFTAADPNLTGSPIEIFEKINTEVRARNNDEIRAITQTVTPEVLWEGAFIRLPRASTRAGFPDERHYMYQDKEIGSADHLGVDLASLKHTEVPAANTGIVAHTGYIGIYGNTVIIDHGMGLFSLYAHLSEIGVEKGSRVKRGDIIGRTGATGLAGGDHLHFSMLVNGHFVNPIEWWDESWIRDRVLANMHAR
ncbi:MAG: M23 family metallopeptidase [Deltaproteobacteria bacterium]